MRYEKYDENHFPRTLLKAFLAFTYLHILYIHSFNLPVFIELLLCGRHRSRIRETHEQHMQIHTCTIPAPHPANSRRHAIINSCLIYFGQQAWCGHPLLHRRVLRTAMGRYQLTATLRSHQD